MGNGQPFGLLALLELVPGPECGRERSVPCPKGPERKGVHVSPERYTYPLGL